MWKVRKNKYLRPSSKSDFHFADFHWTRKDVWRVYRRVRKITKSDYWFRPVCPAVRPSARWDISARTVRILITFDIWVFFENISRNFKFNSNLTIMNMHFTWRRMVCACMISRSLLLRIRNFSDKSCRASQSAQFIFGSFFFPKILPFMR
jgi:hypothetical protein